MKDAKRLETRLSALEHKVRLTNAMLMALIVWEERRLRRKKRKPGALLDLVEQFHELF